jgi:hypothetical protein
MYLSCPVVMEQQNVIHKAVLVVKSLTREFCGLWQPGEYIEAVLGSDKTELKDVVFAFSANFRC